MTTVKTRVTVWALITCLSTLFLANAHAQEVREIEGITYHPADPGDTAHMHYRETSASGTVEFLVNDTVYLGGAGGTLNDFDFLWWFGDGYYSVTTQPTYQLKGPADEYDGALLSTLNYGSGDRRPRRPRKMKYAITSNGDTSTTLLPHTGIIINNFRQAVLGDTMYIILQYRIKTPSGLGQVSIDLSEMSDFASYLDLEMPSFNFLNEAKEPNTLLWDINDQTVTQKNRALLVPISIDSAAAAEHLHESFTITAKVKPISTGFLAREYTDQVVVTVAEAHDPNFMAFRPNHSKEPNVGGQELKIGVGFHNEGSSDAEYIRINCRIDERIDLTSIDPSSITPWDSTLEIVNGHGRFIGYNGTDTSDSMVVYHILPEENMVVFELPRIFLPGELDPTLKNPKLSHGYIGFRANIHENVVLEMDDYIRARAQIIFNNLDAIATNEAKFRYRPSKTNPADDEKGKLPLPLGWIIFIAVMVLFVGYIIIRRR